MATRTAAGGPMGRVLAVLAAGALIVGALVARRAITDGTSASPATTEAPAGREVVCLEELRAVCVTAFGAGVSLTVEPMGATLRRLSATTDPADLPDAWITFAPLPEMLRDALGRAGGPADRVGEPVLVATTRLIVATRPDRAGTLSAACPGPAIWKCLGDVAGTSWAVLGGEQAFQDVKPAFGDPTTSATALMVWVAAVGQYLGADSFSINDVQADDSFTTWGRRLRAADPARGAGDPLAELVLSRVQRDVAGGTEAAASGLAGLALVGEPYARVDLVVSGLGQPLDADTLTALADAAEATGWRRAGPSTPAATRPGFTTYVALQRTWEDLG